MATDSPDPVNAASALARIPARLQVLALSDEEEAMASCSALAAAGAGKVASHFSWDRLENINAIFDTMRAGKIDGRIVLEI